MSAQPEHLDALALARRLDHAVRHAVAIPQLSRAFAMTTEQAYDIQCAGIGLRTARGEAQIGVKMGFTSRAKMVQMGVGDVICGRLTDAMILEEGGTARHGAYIHPRVEPEIAFLLKRPLVGTLTPLQALASVEAVAPAIELIDSRYDNFSFSVHDVIADNASAAGFATGRHCRPTIDCANLGMILSIDGHPVQFGSTAAILGHPMRALVAAAHFAALADEPLQPGWVVLAGAATKAEAPAPGARITLEMERLGSVQLSMGE